MDETWTIAELAERATAALAGLAPANGRVSDVPNERLIRYYTTIGLLDPPLARRGRIALYGRRHLLQLVAVKRRQAEGASNAAIQRELLGATDDHLAALAGGRATSLSTHDAGRPRGTRPTPDMSDLAALPGNGAGRPPGTGPDRGDRATPPGNAKRPPGTGPAPEEGDPATLPANGSIHPGDAGSLAGDVPARGSRESERTAVGEVGGRTGLAPNHPPARQAPMESRPRFWATPPLPPPPRPSFPPVFHGVSLTPEAALLLSRPLTDDEHAAVTVAAQPLIDLLTELGFTEGIPS
ncbi:MerR family transcriptional regulator [Herbidospora sp. NEAU-GS84]|uniref:MerR family transcriptional regulator n=1 Tax=Herbidospora solisilvae TaxID=2696284 RepID=A0A7C9JBT0_9ACTN|nr:MerR family transcriptional regulator [Herbidospora solisilvae]NAS22784.1 MerR family transcriptional regulator [Herbidospora solisilvae]